MLEWITTSPGVAVAIIAAAASIVGGLVAAGVKFLLDFLLAERLKRRWQTIEVSANTAHLSSELPTIWPPGLRIFTTR
jgi:hypothetical protein